MENEHLPKTLLEAVRFFTDIDRCTEFMAMIRWPEGVICPHCKEFYEDAGRELRRFGFDPEDPEAAVTLARGTGCDACYHTGYLDCIGLYELFEWNGTLLNMFTEREALPRLKQAFAWSHRSDALKDDGLKKILAHVTTPEEVYRVL